MKVLTVDAELAPNLAHVWSLWNQNVSLAQLQESAYMLSWAAKWEGKREVIFRSVRDSDHHARLYELLDEAEAVVTYNGDGFDLKHFNREFKEHGLGQPSPFVSVDLLKVVRKNFRLPSNKLDYVAQWLGVGSKMKHEGHGLWVKVMADDPEAWARFERYNKQDVRITEKVFQELRPYIANLNVPLLEGFGEVSLACPSCGSAKVQARGYTVTAISKFRRYQCQSCGRWFRGATRVGTTQAR